MELSRSNQNLMFLPEGSLRIDRAQLYDAGMYECVAINTAGNDTKMMQLNVQGNPHGSDVTLVRS